MLIEKLEGLKVSLNDSDIVEDLTFSGNNVAATIGEKNGAVCSPILELQIQNESSITIIGSGFEINWGNIEINNNQISTTRNGKQSVYDIVAKNKATQHTRRLP